ncbi:MAG TPA: hypothetical protein VHA37_01570 [Candidatus Saccharimonadales bacterium]|nr:hypothetical protein [Candidatus Saccharimonadales bacterium]
MIQVESGDVLAMRDVRFDDVLKEINEKQAQVSYATMLGASAGFLGLGATFLAGQVGLIVLGLVLPAWAIGRWLDSYKRRTVLFYNLEEDAKDAYEALTKAFDQMAACSGKWRIEAGGAVRDVATWKRNAGASHIIDRKPTGLSYAAPHGIATNITPPAVLIGKRTIYFFPDAAFIFDGKRMGAVGYDSLAIRWQNSNFIEEGTVPGDAQVVGHTWKHPNKNGGPDRRFASNYQIPVCLYEAALFASESGLNEMLEFSRTGVIAPFVNALNELGQKTGRSTKLLAQTN